jgi:hypothetical protein
MPIDGIEVTRAGQSVPALHVDVETSSSLRREALPPAGSAALEDCPAGPSRHARPEAVPALAPANFGLIGALHEEMKERSRPSKEGRRQYREQPDHRLFHNGRPLRDDEKSPALGLFSPVNTPSRSGFSTGVEESGDSVKRPGNQLFFWPLD